MFHSKKTDEDLEKDVIDELEWDPSVNHEDISVKAREGVITLRGNVPHYLEKHTAELAAQRVNGVHAIANEIQIKLMGAYERSDEDIANTALIALDWNVQVPKGIKVTIENGLVTLRGEVEWNYQKTAAESSVSQLMGVRGVHNEISIKNIAKTQDIKTRIEDALKRTAQTEGSEINVLLDGTQVTLTGKVRSFAEMDDARLSAWSAKGVSVVKDHLTLSTRW